jgi:hypothetical protein
MPSLDHPSLHLPISDDDDSDSEMISNPGSLPPFSPSITSSLTSNSASMRSQSPVPSVLSLTSAMVREAYKREYGRDLNNYSDIYGLPADNEELQRLGNL